MRFYKERQYYMLGRVANFLGKKKDALSVKTPVLKKNIALYLAKYKTIRDMAMGKIKTTWIDTNNKNTAKGGLIEMILKMTGVLRTHHSPDDGDANLPEEATYTFTELNTATVVEFPKMCGLVIKSARDLPDLREYGMSKADINEAQAYLDEYNAVKKSPALRRKDIAKNNRAIDSGIDQCIRFLENKIDPMITIATEGNADLRASYKGFRKVLARNPGSITDKEKRYRKSRARKKKKP